MIAVQKMSRVLILLLATATLASCVISVHPDQWESEDNWDDDDFAARERVNTREIDRLSIGMSLDNVVSAMGQPDIKEAFVRSGKDYYVYYYRTHREHSDYKTTKDEATPLVFVEGQLVGWGESAIEHALVDSR